MLKLKSLLVLSLLFLFAATSSYANRFPTGDWVAKRLPEAETKAYTVLVKEDNVAFTLSNKVEYVGVITNTHAFIMFKNGKCWQTNHSLDPYITPGRVVWKKWHTYTKDAKTTTGYILRMRDLNVSPDHDIVVQIGRYKRAFPGENPRFIAGTKSGASLGNYPIHHNDLPDILSDMSGSLKRGYTYQGQIYWGFNFAEFFELAYPERKFAEGEFERVATLNRNDSEWRKDYHNLRGFRYRSGTGRTLHTKTTLLAAGLLSKNILAYNRTRDRNSVDFEVAYLAHHWITMIWKGVGNSGHLNEIQGINNAFDGYWGRFIEGTYWYRVHVRQIQRSLPVIKMWERGEDIPASPSIGGLDSSMREELKHWEELPMGPAPGQTDKLTTLGELKRE